jgi:hypothetical protein
MMKIGETFVPDRDKSASPYWAAVNRPRGEPWDDPSGERSIGDFQDLSIAIFLSDIKKAGTGPAALQTIFRTAPDARAERGSTRAEKLLFGLFRLLGLLRLLCLLRFLSHSILF